MSPYPTSLDTGYLIVEAREFLGVRIAMLDKLLVQGRRPPFPTLARSASRVQNVR